MKEKIIEIIDKYIEGNYLISSSEKAKMASEILLLLKNSVCQVCEGSGVVPNGFYTQTNSNYTTTSITPEPCRSCNVVTD